MTSDKDNKVVNTEEQNRTVNPGNTDNQESASHQEPVTDEKINRPAETEKPEGISEAETLHRTEDEDATGSESKTPAL